MRRLTFAAACATTLVTISLVGAAPGSQAATPLQYVALGDSYSAASGCAPARPRGGTAVPALDQQLPAPDRDEDRRRADRCHLRRRRHQRLLRVPVRRRAAPARRTREGHAARHDDDRRQRQGVFINTILQCGTAGLATAGQGSPCKDQYGSSFSGHHPPEDLPGAGEGPQGRPRQVAEGEGRDPRLPVDHAGDRRLLRQDADRHRRRALRARHPDDAQRRRAPRCGAPPAARTSTSTPSPRATTPASPSGCAGSSRCCRAPTRSSFTPTRSASRRWPRRR